MKDNSGFKPLITREEALKYLNAFFQGKYPRNELEYRLKHGWEVYRDAFNRYKATHKEGDEWTDFYFESDSIIFDGLQWYLTGRWSADRYVLEVGEKADGKKVLDFGGGIGLTAICLALSGYSVTYVDYSLKSRVAKFAQFLAEKLNVKDKIQWKEWKDVDGVYNYIVSVDVLEHIIDWKSCFDRFLEIISPEGAVYIDARFEPKSRERPSHLNSDITLYDYLLSKGYKLGAIPETHKNLLTGKLIKLKSV